MTEVALLSEKLHRFGAVGAGVIPDHLSTLRFVEARVESATATTTAATPAKESPGGSSADAVKKSAAPKPAGAPQALAPASAAKAYRPPDPARAKSVADGAALTREEILDILAETVRVQGIVQQEVSVLARKLAKDKDKGQKKIRKPPPSFAEGYKKIQELGLPQEPLEDYSLTETKFQTLLMDYEKDEEVMTAAQQLLHPVSKGDPDRARGISMDKIIEIHQFMVVEMQKVLQEFLQLPQDTRRSFTGKGCETTAELLVSIAVEQQIGVRCEDVEHAVIMYEEPLQSHADFTSCTEKLALMMQTLIGATQPRVEQDTFMKILRHMGDSSKKAKTFAKKLYEDYRSKSCSIMEAYNRFEEFSDGTAANGEELPELSSVEMQLCYEEYRANPEVRSAWEQSGAESNLLMQAMMTGRGGAGGASRSSPSSPSLEEKPKGKKLKASEVVGMQELMVDELKRTVEAAKAALKGKNGQWKAELAVQMVQALASAAVERRYGASAEEMTVAGFNHAATLQRNERFVRATGEQQDLLMQITQVCGG